MIPKPLVYIAGPYSSEPVANTRRAIQCGMELWASDLVAVIIPHLSLLADLVTPMALTSWYAFDRDLLAHCDAMMVMPGKSAGVIAEIAEAEALGLPTFRSGDELLAWASKWTALARMEIER